MSLIERGQLGGVRMRILDDLAHRLGADLAVALRWRGGDIDRLLDEGHAVLLDRVAAVLEAAGWVVTPEVTFAIYADHGSIDVLAWHQPTSTVMVVEAKTQLTSVEETLRTHDMKARVALRVALERADRHAPEAVAHERRMGDTTCHPVGGPATPAPHVPRGGPTQWSR